MQITILFMIKNFKQSFSMKKNIVIGGLFLLAFVATSCSKERKANMPENKGFEYTLNFNDAPWGKSAYTPGTGIGLSGNEKIAVLYKKSDKYYGDAGNAILATKSGGAYSFTAPEDLTDLDVYTIMPYSKYLTKPNANPGSKVYIRLSPVQFPEANSFDPMCDYLVGKPVTGGAQGSTTLEVPGYKRLFAPLKLTITGLSDEDKIYAASLSLDQAASGLSSLAGIYRIILSDDFSKAGQTYVAADNYPVGNSLTAIYQDGLSKGTDGWNVWFMVNPITIAAGTKLSLRVVTATKTYSRTVDLPSASTLLRDKYNTLTVNAKGSGYTEKTTVFQAFTTGTLTASPTLTASDGNDYIWTSGGGDINLTGADRDGGSDMKGGLFLYNGRYVTLPSLSGGSTESITVFVHPVSAFKQSGTDCCLTLYDSNDGQISSNYWFNYGFGDNDSTSLYSIAGSVTIPRPVNKGGIGGLKIKGPNVTNFSASAILMEVYEPKIDHSIVLDFSGSNWPFTEASPGGGFGSDSKDYSGIHTFNYSDGGNARAFTMSATTDVCLNSTQGLRLGNGAGDYIEFPAIPAKKLVQVSVLKNTKTATCSTPKITDISGNMVVGGDAFKFTNGTQVEEHAWNLRNTAANTSYRIVATESGVEMKIYKLTLGYEDVE